MPGKRFAFLPIGALAVALLSYGLGAVDGTSGSSGTGGPASGPPADAIQDPGTQPALPAEAAAIGVVGSSDTDARIEFWRDRIDANPGSDVQYQYLGELFSLKGRETGDLTQYGLASDAFRRAIELYPGNVVARQGLAITLVTLHRWTDAIDEATVILQDDVRAMGAVAVIGDASLELGDLDTARAAFATLRQKADGPSIESRFARLAFLTGDTDRAIELLDGAARSAADLNRPLEEQAFYHYSAGEYRLSQGDSDGARRSFEAALAALPDYYLAIAGSGRVAFAEGDLTGAIEAYRAAVAIIPKPELLAYLGDLYAVSGDRAAAEEQYRTVEFIARLGELQADVFNRELALFQATHRRDTAHAVELAAAELGVRKDVYGYDALAWALYHDGRADQALEPARTAVSLGTRDPKLLYHLGMIEMATGRTAAGKDHLRDAIELNPAFDPLGAVTAREALAD